MYLEAGFVRGKGNGSLFYHEEQDVRSLVHGDDFVAISDEMGISWHREIVANRYVHKDRGTLGPDQ